MSFSRPDANYMYEVTRAFIRGEVFHKNSMSCTSSALYSYGAIIAFYHNGEIVLNKRKYSTTSTYHQNAAEKVIGSAQNRAWTDGQYLDSRHMMYSPKQHNNTILDINIIPHYVAAARLLKNRSHTAYAKKLINMSPDEVVEHNKNVVEYKRKEEHDRKMREFIRGTKLRKTVHKLGERGTCGKIVGDKFYIFGVKGAGSLLKLKMMMSDNTIEEGTDLSTIGDTRDWRDHRMKITGVSKLGVKFNDKFMSNKQLKQMMKRGDVSV